MTKAVAVHAGPFRGAPRLLLERAIRRTLAEEGVAEGEVSLALLDDAAIQALNRAHLGRDAITDVLAFALHGEEEPVLGDVYVGAEQARRQASEAGVSEVEELVRLAVHGTLHVLGWNHPKDGEQRLRSPMWLRQEALVAQVMR